MRSIRRLSRWLGAVCLASLMASNLASAADEKPKSPISAAVIKFQDRSEGAKSGFGASADAAGGTTGGGAAAGKSPADKVADLLGAELMAVPELMMVERDEIDRMLKEHELNLSGLVSTTDAVKVGQLTGARLLITGSVIDSNTDRYLVAKIISTETSRVLGTSVKGKTTEGLGDLVTKLSQQIASVVDERGATILPAEVSREDRLAVLKKAMEGKKPLSVMVRIAERHVGAPKFDPAAETEITSWCKELGWTTIDPTTGNEGDADILITGEGISEFAARRGGLVTVRARVEVKAVHRKSGELIAIDRETVRAVDLSEQIAGKDALQKAGAAIAERILSKITIPEKGKNGKKK